VEIEISQSTIILKLGFARRCLFLSNPVLKHDYLRTIFHGDRIATNRNDKKTLAKIRKRQNLWAAEMSFVFSEYPSRH